MSSAGNQIDVLCPHCGLTFQVPISMAGGLANCPDCRKASPVADKIDWIFTLTVGGGILGVIVFSGLFLLFLGPLAAGLALLLGIVIVILAVMAS